MVTSVALGKHEVRKVCIFVCRTYDKVLSIEGLARAERDGTREETRFRLSPKRMSPFKSVGASVQSTAGSEVCASALVMLDIPRSEVA